MFEVDFYDRITITNLHLKHIHIQAHKIAVFELSFEHSSVSCPAYQPELVFVIEDSFRLVFLAINFLYESIDFAYTTILRPDIH